MSSAMPLLPASVPTIRRLPAYLEQLRRLHADGHATVSSTVLAKRLGLEPIQVRKDLAHTGAVGRPRVGFDTAEVIACIVRFLGWDRKTDAVVVGAGSLGTALIGYQGFASYGLDIVAAFDRDPAKVGRPVHGRPVLPMDALHAEVDRRDVPVALLTVTSEAAQDATDRLVAAGIRAIWNFTPVALRVPDEVLVQDAELTSELALLSVMLAESQRRAPDRDSDAPPSPDTPPNP